MKNYKKTLRACYLGLITQAIAANFAPLLFLTFHSDFNISLGQIALIPAVFYVTQLSVDLICAKYVDSIGYRKSIVASQLFAGLGLIGLAASSTKPSRCCGSKTTTATSPMATA